MRVYIVDACELWMAKDRSEQEVFWCRETPSMFILCTHLQGHKRNSIEIIIIKEEGRDQTLTSEDKPIQKLVIMGEVISKSEEQILGFRKVFKIPNGVVPDQIKAIYSEEESVLKICMPKFVKEVCGVQIEEVKEEEFGESSHKVMKEFKVHAIDENPKNRVLKIRNKYGESDHDDQREEDDKEETEVVKNLEVKENEGEENQEVSNKNIMIQSLEESDDDNGVLGRQDDEETIRGRKKREIIEDTEEKKRVKEDDRIEIEGPYKYEIEDRDVEVKEGAEESHQLMKTSNNTFVKGGSNQIQEIAGKEGFEGAMAAKEALQGDETEITEGDQHQTGIEDETCKEGSQAKKKVEALFEATVNEEKQPDSNDVKLLRSSKLESPLGIHNNHEVMIERESHGGHETEVEVDEHGLKDIQVEASNEEEKANEQRDGVYVESSKEVDDDELEDIKVEAREEDNNEASVEISKEVEERRERQFKENDEVRKKLHGPLFVAAGSAFVVSLVVFFVRHTRVGRRL